MKHLILSISVIIFSIACTQKQAEQSFNEDGKFSFAVSGEFKPFSFIDKNGALIGFDVEVGKAIAKELGRSAEPVRFKFPGIIEGVNSGRFDAAVASHTITDERKQHVAFSKPYYYSGAQVFLRADDNLQSLEELKNKEIAVSKGSTYVKMAEKFTEDTRVYDSDITALRALANGRHDAVITDFVAGRMAIKEGVKLKEGPMIDRSSQAVVVPKQADERLSLINQALNKLRESGELKRLSEKYFGSDITTIE